MSWLRTFESRELSPAVICRLAYEDRQNVFMRQISGLSKAPRFKSSSDAIHHDFQLLRHYIGRLGYHIRATKNLISCAPRMIHLLDDYKVEGLEMPSRAPGLPPADEKTRLDSILVRMQPVNCPNVPKYQEALEKMDDVFHLTHRVLETYQSPNIQPRVHAEVLVLQHFNKNDLAFEDRDRYIACSKPACYCCALYFRNHPGRFEQPPSHSKLYLNWRPPGFDLEPESDEWKEQRDVIIEMTKVIRAEVLRQIWESRPRHPWHPDSVTGITESFWTERERELEQDLQDRLDMFDATTDESGRNRVLQV